MGMPSIQLPNSNQVSSYSSIALANSGKKGVLKDVGNGYKEILLGAFGAFGNGGWLYDTASAMRYLENDQEFLRMMQAGRIRGEWGHPVRPPGMSDQDWFVRICTIVEANMCCHIRRVRPSLDTVVDERGRKVIALIGEVKPSGKEAKAFGDMLDNPDEDVNFSIRCFAKKNFGNMTKHMTKIITWDFVFDPGIALTTKYNTPSMESKSVTRQLDEAEFNLERLRNGFDHTRQNNTEESFESVAPAVEILGSLYEKTKSQIFVPTSLGW